MKINRHVLILLCIFAVGFTLRFYKLGQIPFGLYQDETAIGYNAYSLLLTGKDEHGIQMPLYFKSFGDYKLPIYVYATVPSIKIFGLTPFAVRLPSALFGFLSIIVLYVFVKRLTDNTTLATISAALFAINPWHIHYSRATFEVSIALFFFMLGAYLLLYAQKSAKMGFFLSGTLCFIISLYSYNLTRLLAPVLYALTVWSFFRGSRKPTKKEIIATGIISLGLISPLIFTIFQKGGISSSSGTLIFTSATLTAPRIEFQSYMVVIPSLIRKAIFNSFFLTTNQYLQNVIGYLSVPFFFLTGSAHGNHGIGNVGQLYLFELPLLFLGMYKSLKENLLWAKYLLCWVIATIMVAALTREVPHATRSFFLLAPLEIFSAFGLIYIATIVTKTRNVHTKILSLVSMIGIGLFSVLFYFASYFIRFPIAYAPSWRSADADVSAYIQKEEPKYEKIIFDTHAGFMYSSLLFYNRIDPLFVQNSTTWSPDDSEGFSFPDSIGKYEFRSVHWDQDLKNNKTLVITTPDQKPSWASPLMAFYYPKRPVVFAVKQSIMQYPVEDIAYVAVSLETKPTQSR